VGVSRREGKNVCYFARFTETNPEELPQTLWTSFFVNPVETRNDFGIAEIDVESN